MIYNREESIWFCIKCKCMSYFTLLNPDLLQCNKCYSKFNPNDEFRESIRNIILNEQIKEYKLEKDL